MSRIRLTCRSSSSDETYSLVAYKTDSGVRFACTCPAGENGYFCNHRHAVMIGDVSHLIDPDVSVLAEMQTLFTGHPYWEIAAELALLEQQAEKLKRQIKKKRDMLAKSLMG